MSHLAVSAHGLGKQYRLGQVETGLGRLRRRIRGRQGAGHIWALKDVTFDVATGEAVAVIGRNGAGKSTLLKVLSQITEPTAGYVDVAGRVGVLLEVGTGFSQELTGRENIFLNGAILGMSKAEVARKFDEIVAFSGVEKHIDTPVKWYSTGMYVRLAFAVAAHLEPEILIVDEVLAVGDAEFQRKCLGRMSEIASEGRTVLFVSHNMQIVRRLCRRGIVLEEGQIVLDDDIETAVAKYLETVEADPGDRRRWNRKERLGDDACEIVEVRVSDDADELKPTFFTSRPIHVTVEFIVPRHDPQLNVAFEVADSDGVVAFLSSFRDLPDGQWPTLRPGLNALRCTIPAGLLNSGRYAINLRVLLEGERWIVRSDSILQFDVLADHGESLFFVRGAASRPGVVAPILDWKLVEATSSDEDLAPAMTR